MSLSFGRPSSVLFLSFAIPAFLVVGCDKLPQLKKAEVTEDGGANQESEMVEPVAPPVQHQPKVVAEPKSPEQILAEFKALKPSEIEDQHLESIANLEAAQTTFETLDLSQSKVSDQGIQKLAKFKNLTSLNLSKTYVRGTGLQGLELDKLQELSLDNTQFDSSVGAKIKDLQSLKTLGLRAAGLNDSFYEILAQLPHLEVLHLDGNKLLLGVNFSEMIKSGNFENLRVLTVSDSQFGYYGLLAVDQLKHLEILDAGSSGLNLKAILPISKCKKLRELNLSANPLSNESLVPLKRIKSLEVLNLADCQGLSDPGTKTLRTMKHLKKLKLTGTSMTPKAIESLQKVLKETDVVFE